MERTVDGNGNALSKNETISANKSGDLSELVDLLVLGRNTTVIQRRLLHHFELETILLGRDHNRQRAHLSLDERQVCSDLICAQQGRIEPTASLE